MASATALLAQSNPALLCAFPGWKQPTHMHLRATIAGASGAATVVSAADATTGEAGTTIGVSVVRQAAGTYDLTFPPCRQIALGTFQCTILPNVIATGTQARQFSIDKTDANTSAKLGKLRFNLIAAGGSTVTDPVDGSEMNLSFWADLG